MKDLVLSIFPGIDLLGMGFEQEGFCVVRGPDLIWGGDIRGFHPLAGVFDGVIGGPPCKGESLLAHLNGNPGASMRAEFARVTREAQPRWWVMEAVKNHDTGHHCACVEGPTGGSAYGSPIVHDYDCPGFFHVLKLSPRWLGEKQSRRRYFHSNWDLERRIEVSVFEHREYKRAVLAGHGGARGTVVRRMATYTTEEMQELQGIGAPLAKPPFWTEMGFREAIGNGVPIPMARAIAKAVRQALR